MKLTNLIILIPMLFMGCVSMESDHHQNQSRKGKLINPSPKEIPNQFGWDKTNCAHIQADGHCAHPTGGNTFGIDSSPKPLKIPSTNQINSSNCAHILADGTCAHPL